MIKRILITSIFPLAFSLLYLIFKGFDQLINYCDAFFISGAAILLFGALLWVANEGTFDIFGYSFSTLKTSFSRKTEKQYEDFTQYSQIKSENRKKKNRKFLNFFISGAIFIAISIIIRLYL